MNELLLDFFFPVALAAALHLALHAPFLFVSVFFALSEFLSNQWARWGYPRTHPLSYDFRRIMGPIGAGLAGGLTVLWFMPGFQEYEVKHMFFAYLGYLVYRSIMAFVYPVVDTAIFGATADFKTEDTEAEEASAPASADELT